MISIILAGDNNYSTHIHVVITSILENCSKPYQIRIFVLDGGIGVDNKESLSKLVFKYRSEIFFIMITDEMLKGFRVDRHVTVATYYRIFAPNLLPKQFTKAIYLDSDIIVNGDIIELWNFDLDTKILGAVESKNLRRFEELNEFVGCKYFNAGVLLIDLEKWRKGDWTSKLIMYIKDNPNKLKFWDQDALNLNFVNNWKPLPETWNYLNSSWYDKPKDLPCIVHFVASFKPWHYRCRHPFKYLYFNYLKISEKKPDKMVDFSVLNFFKKQFAYSIIYSGLLFKSLSKITRKQNGLSSIN